MAKGRKFTPTTQRERLLGRNTTTTTKDPSNSEFREEEVWSTGDVNEREREQRHVGGLSLAFDRMVQLQYHDALSSSPNHYHMSTSAPVNVPGWTNILRVNEDDHIDDSEMVPPHEYLARTRKMAANSVFEGVGRTLKGRDMRRVRDAVWSQTGFDG